MRTIPTDELIERWVPFYEEAHAFPELSHAEHRTTEQIERALDVLGVEHFRVSATGTVGVVRNGEGPVVAFRADIDGLPVTEDTGLPYASTVVADNGGEPSGTMHACGHDTHFSSLLGAVDHLLAHRDTWAGTLVLVFQPAEEVGSGARAMLDGGLWERAPRPEVVLSQHVGPLPENMVAVREGNMFNLADTLTVTVHGKQAHGSQPESSVDPIVAAASMIVRLQTISSREVAPTSGVVVTVGRIRGGTAPNIIPDTCEFSVNVRTPDTAVRQRVMDAVHRILDAEAAASRASVTHVVEGTFPRCFNDHEQTGRVRSALASEFGEGAVIGLAHPVSASEDAGLLGDEIDVATVYWMFGGFAAEAFADGEGPPGNHSPHFAPDARATLRTGVRAAVSALGVYLAVD